MDSEKEQEWLLNLKRTEYWVHFEKGLGEETILAAMTYLRQEPRRGFK